jgi:hypothetical protein
MKAFERRLRAHCRGIIRDCRDMLNAMDYMEELHPDWPKTDRGRFLVPLAGVEKMLESIKSGEIRDCIDSNRPIPQRCLFRL